MDEYAVSAVWLGGIPLVSKIADYFIRKKGFNPDVNLKLFKNNSVQNIDENIKNFKGKVPDRIIDELIKKLKIISLFMKNFLHINLLPQRQFLSCLWGNTAKAHICIFQQKK